MQEVHVIKKEQVGVQLSDMEHQIVHRQAIPSTLAGRFLSWPNLAKICLNDTRLI
jgi:hypothetical protein